VAARAVAVTDTLYQAFGTAISSEIPLPLPLATDTVVAPAWSIVRGSRDAAYVQGEPIAEDWSHAACHNGQVINRTYGGEDDSGSGFCDTGLYHVSIADRQVTVYADPGADDRAIGLVLIGQVSIYMLHRLGFPILHASAVLVYGEAVALVAPAGNGKSAMAGSFLRRGATLLSDDVLPLVEHGDEIHAMPGAPMMKVWSQTATETFGIHQPLPDLTANVQRLISPRTGAAIVADVRLDNPDELRQQLRPPRAARRRAAQRRAGLQLHCVRRARTVSSGDDCQ
jgi:hypothetical protein